MKYRIYLIFHLDIQGVGIYQVNLIIKAANYDAAFKGALTIKDRDFQSLKLKTIEVHEDDDE